MLPHPLDFETAPEFLRAWIREQPKRGRGIGAQLAQRLGISATMVSQTLSGDKTLSPEIALQMAEALGLSEDATDALLLMVERDRAGHHRLKARLTAQLERLRAERRDLSSRVRKDQSLSETERATYYSSWLYSAVRNLSALPNVNSVDDISVRLGVPRSTAQRVVDFLLESNLCATDESGHLSYAKQWTHLPAKSPLVRQHHQNWRIQGFRRMEEQSDEHLFITAPMSMSVQVAVRVRERLLKLIEEVQKEVGPSPSEATWCLNLDWYDF
jgi:uncharacterized protein (TIGR02147 family)